MEIEPTYDELFQDKLIFESIGRGSYYEETYPELVRKRNRKPTRFVKYILNAEQEIRKKHNKRGNLLFLEHTFENIARNLNKNYNIYLLHDSINIYKDYRNQKYYQHFYRTWLKEIDKSFITHNMSYALGAMKQVESFLVNNDIDLVFTGNDKMFMEKLLLTASKNVNIQTVVIQHGIYTDEVSFEKLKTADTAENFWTWSQYVKDCYLRRYGKKDSCVKVIGYPFDLLEPSKGSSKAVLFIGNNYRKGDSIEGSKFIKVAKVVLDVCNELNIPFYYRPHPGEIVDSEYGDILNHISRSNKLLEDIANARIVVGDISSVMVEAGLCRKHVIQIMWNQLSRTASTDPLYGFTIKVNEARGEIREAICQCLNSDVENEIDEYYLYRNQSFFDDINKYVDELIRNK